MASNTGQAIRQELQRYGLIRLIGQATAGAGGANRLRDVTRLLSGGLAATSFEDCYLRVYGSAGNVDGEVVKVDYLDMDAGDLYVTPSFSAAPDSSTTYEIWRRGIFPDDVDRLRDEALTSICSRWQLLPISHVTNAAYFIDLTGWTATSATQARQGGTFPTEVWPASTLVTNSGVDGRSASTSIYALQPTDGFWLYVPVSVRAQTASVIVRDVTNSVNITLNGTSTATRRGWTGLQVSGTIPATCDEVQVWLGGASATMIAEFGPVFFQTQGARRVQLERPESRDFVGSIYRLTQYASETGDKWGEEYMEEVKGVRRRQVNDVVNLMFDERILDDPYLYEERVFYEALSTTYLTAAGRVVGDAATTDCPLDYAGAATAKLVAERYLTDDPQFYGTVLAKAQERLAKYERRFGPEPKAIQERDRVIWVPQLKV